MTHWKTLADQEIYKNPTLRLHLEQIETSEGQRADWTVVDIADGVAVAAEGVEGLCLISQYRHAVREFVWEFPAGRVEAGEDVQLAGARELAEEAGLVAEEYQSLGSFWPLDGICRHRIHLFWARGLSQTAMARETFEDMEVQFFSRAELKTMVKKGAISCGIAQTMLLRLFLHEDDSKS